jgi:tetratricopeptide (TPR) repeat protein
LHRARLLVEAGEVGYQFPHDLIREVVLADLSAVRRRQWHRWVAEALEQAPGEAPVEQLAYHYLRAGVNETAVLYLEQAGDRALALCANAEAAGYYRELLAQLGHLKRPLDAARACEKLGKLLTVTWQLEEALEVLSQAEATYRTAGDRERQQLVLAEIGHLHARRRRSAEGLQLLLPLLEAAGPATSPRVLAAVYKALASLYNDLQRYQESLAAAEQAVALARMTGDDAVLVPALELYDWALFTLGQFEQGLQVAEEVHARAERVGDLWHVSDSLGIFAWHACVVQGAFAQSRAYRDRGLELSERLGDPELQYWHLITRGRLNFLSGDWQAARADGERARALNPWKGDYLDTCSLLVTLGLVSLAEGQWAEATRWLEEGMAMAERTQNLNAQGSGQATLAERDLLAGQPQVARARLEPLLAHLGLEHVELFVVLPLLAWAALQLGEQGQAEALLAQALAQTRQVRLFLPDVLRIQALLCIRQERWEEAQAVLEETLSLCQAMPYPYAEAKALYVYGLLHQAKGEPAQAHERWKVALAILHRLGERLYAEQVERALAGLEH